MLTAELVEQSGFTRMKDVGSLVGRGVWRVCQGVGEDEDGHCVGKAAAEGTWAGKMLAKCPSCVQVIFRITALTAVALGSPAVTLNLP